MKIGVAQLNGVVGDFPGNAKRILAGYRECLEGGADLVVTPELSLVGYPPRDLIFRSEFVNKCLQALDYLAGEVKEVPLIVGYVDFSPKCTGKPFQNSAAWLENGKIQHRVAKSLLPTYDVFDERRYFEPGLECEVIRWKGAAIGVTICEDIWTADYLPNPLYEVNRVRELAEGGAEIVINLSASPFHSGKPAKRRAMLQEVVTESKVALVYTNLVGGNDHLVFDGHSLAFRGDGTQILQMEGFVEQCATVDLAEEGEKDAVFEVVSDIEQMYKALVLGVRDYVGKCGFTSVCLGLSGGIDSALTAVIAADAIGPENVYGVTMPSPYSSGGSVEDSFDLARKLGISCQEVSISEPFEAVKRAGRQIFQRKEEDVTEENVQARLRGLLLMSLSNKDHHLLLTTGNKSELAVGYCTIYGDMCGGLAVISDLPKTFVFEMSRWINRNEERIPWNTIEKPPSAELKPDQKDQDTLPEYDVLDAILDLYVVHQLDVDEIVAQGHDETLVRWIQRRVDLNEWKRQQAAPGIRVTTKAFGMGRRMPIAQRYG